MKKVFVVLDVETLTSARLVFDVAWHVCDSKGNILESYNALVKEIVETPFIFELLRHDDFMKNKCQMYIDALVSNSINVKSLYEISDDFYDIADKYNAKPIVFVEEPEAHLHPKNQIKLISLFSNLHNYGIKLVVSSHSNYIFNKLNNLLLEKAINPSIYSPILLQSKENGSVSSFMMIDELGVDDTNFLDVTAQLYDEREALIENWTK